jgi:hypothetical protein
MGRWRSGATCGTFRPIVKPPVPEAQEPASPSTFKTIPMPVQAVRVVTFIPHLLSVTCRVDDSSTSIALPDRQPGGRPVIVRAVPRTGGRRSVVIAAAVIVGILATLIAAQLPRPADVVGAVAVGGVAALAVAVGYLVWAVHDRDRRLQRIERLISRDRDA